MKVDTNITEVISPFINKITQLDNYDKTLARKTKNNFLEVYNSIMSNFYSYSPKRYRRTHLYRGIGRGYLRDNVGGIIISPNFSMHIYADYYNRQRRHIKITTENVMDLMWNQGVRGLPPGYKGSLSYIANITTLYGPYAGTPYIVMENYVNDYINKNLPETTSKYIKSIFEI